MFGLNPLNLKLIAGLGVVILLLLAVSVGLYWRAEAAVKDRIAAQLERDTAIAVNDRNTRTLRELRIDRQIERVLTQKEIEAAQRRATSIDKTKKEMQNVPGANDTVHPYFDELGDRLRKSLDSGTAD